MKLLAIAALAAFFTPAHSADLNADVGHAFANISTTKKCQEADNQGYTGHAYLSNKMRQKSSIKACWVSAGDFYQIKLFGENKVFQIEKNRFKKMEFTI